MRKGASYIIVLVLVAAALFLLYSSGPRFTGYAVLQEGYNQTACGDAGYVWYNEACYDEQPVCDADFLELCLDETNCTEVGNGYWYNDVCNAEEEPSCSNDLTLCLDETNCTEVGNGYWYDANEDGNLTCNAEEEPSCSNDLTLCLDEINCTNASGYWYNDLCHEAELLSLTINEPSGTKNIDSGIPIEFTITGGENISLSCLYNIKYVSDDTIAIANTTLADCNNSSFDVPDEGDYVLNLYVNNFEGLFHDDSSFSVSLSTETEETSETTTEEEESAGESSVQIQVTPSFELIATELSAISLASGDSQEVIWSVSSTGRNPVSACSVNPLGDYASWIVISGDTLNINAGEEGIFAFSVLVPEETEEGSYLLSVSIECAETAVSKDFNVEVSGITEETGEGAPVGGFVIFGEGGLGVGGIIILVFVVLALGAVLFFARRMRKSGKTLRDIFNNLKFIRRPQ